MINQEHMDIATHEDAGDPNPTAVGYIGLVGTLHITALIIAIAALFHVVDNGEFRQKVLDAPDALLRAAQQEQHAALLGPARWVNREQGLARINIQQAMDLTIADLNKNKAAAAPPPEAGVHR